MEVLFLEIVRFTEYTKHKFNDYGNSIGIEEIFYKKKFNYRRNSKLKLKFLKQIRKCHHLNSDSISVYDYV